MASQLSELTCCSICLETFTRPKTLPCLHSYCYACLLLVSKHDANTLTCPQCREEHTIPKEGVKGFRDNTLLNNLLTLSEEKEESLCEDCQLKNGVEICEHCGSNVCGKCFIQHAKLSSELNTKLECLKYDLENMKVKIEEDGEFYENLEIEVGEELDKIAIFYAAEAMKKLREVRFLLDRSSSLSSFMKLVLGIYHEVKEEARGEKPIENSQLFRLLEKTTESKTTESLKELRSEVADLETIVRLLQSTNERFKFIFDADHLGQIEYGQSVVNIQVSRSCENLGERLLELSADAGVLRPKTSESFVVEDLSMKDTISREESEASTETNQQVLETSSPKLVEGLEARLEDEARSTEVQPRKLALNAGMRNAGHGAEDLCQLVIAESRDISNRQNRLPTNVDYHNLCKRRVIVTTVGHESSKEESWRKISFPEGFAYHAERKELYVADSTFSPFFSGIKVYNVDGSGARVLYNARAADGLVRDVAISSDGKHIYLLMSRSLMKMNFAGDLSKRMKCSLGIFRDCVSVIGHSNLVLVLEKSYKCVIVYKDDKQIHHFGTNTLKNPCRMAVGSGGQVYVVDDGGKCVKVFQLDGTYVETILEHRKTLGPRIVDIAVDGDGFVCICLSPWGSNRIDVYDPRRDLVTSITGIGLARSFWPEIIHFTPDDRLVVWDHINHMQIIDLA